MTIKKITRLAVAMPVHNGVSHIAQAIEYIARHDGDDYSNLTRLEKQVEFLDNNPGIGLAGSNIHIVDENNNIKNTSARALSDRDTALDIFNKTMKPELVYF